MGNNNTIECPNCGTEIGVDDGGTGVECYSCGEDAEIE